VRKKEGSKVLCFEVHNYERVFASDPEALTRLEEALALKGALPAKVDFPTRVYCVTVEKLDLSVAEILDIFAQHGFQAHYREGG
jgi:hypothetical protein